MEKDYKRVLKQKKATASKIMSRKQMQQCNVCIHAAAAGALVAGTIPIPVVDAIPISGVQTTMVIALGKVFNQEIPKSAVKGLLTSAAATLVGRTVVKAIPIGGWVVSGAVAATVTEAIGWSIAVDLAQGAKTKWDNEAETTEPCDDSSKTKTAEETYKNETQEIINGLNPRVDAFLKGAKTPKANRDEYNELLKDFNRVLDEIPVDDPLRKDYDALFLLAI